MNFMSRLLNSQGYNNIYTCIDSFTKFVQLIPYFKGAEPLSAPKFANLFFSNIIQLFGVPKMVLHDHESRFNV